MEKEEIKIFNHPSFGEIRTGGNAEHPLFCLTDVCRVLGLTSKGVNQRLGDRVISNYPIVDSIGRRHLALFVNEDGLYDVILESRKTEARAFRKWITSEVLPCIRRHGMYATDKTLERMEHDPEYGAALIRSLENERAARHEMEAQLTMTDRRLAEMTPMADYCKQILMSESTVTVTQIAQDYGYSAYAFNELLRDMGLQFRQNEQWILYARFKTDGYVQSQTSVYARYDGSQGTRMHTRWTQRGRMFLYSRLKKAGIVPLMEQTK